MSEFIELFGDATGNCLRASIALEEAGVPYTARIVDLVRREHQSPAFALLNPQCKVPVLAVHKEGRLVLSQSNAIMMWAAEHGPTRLLPLEPAKRASALERFFYFVTDVIAVNHSGFISRHQGHLEAANMQNLRSLHAAAAADGFLVERGPFMAGTEFTLADISAFTVIRSMTSELDLDKLPHLQRWFELVGARKGVQQGLAAFARPPRN